MRPHLLRRPGRHRCPGRGQLVRPVRTVLAAVGTAAALMLGTGIALAADPVGIGSRADALRSITDGLALVDSGQAKIAAGRDWLAANPGAEEPPPAQGTVTAAAVVVDNRRARVDWQSTRAGVTGWHIGRDGQDTSGFGAWSTDLPAAARTFTFDLLRSGVTYKFTLTPKTAAGNLPAVTAQVTMPGATTPPPTTTPPVDPPPAGSGDTAAQRFGWGTPIAAGSDEFNGTGRPDATKWNLPNGCFAGHAGQGRRCADNSTVGGGVLTQTGEANGDTGWMQSKHNSYRGRWETRMRVDPSARNANYNMVALLWPVAEDFPVGGEVDYAETKSTASNISFFLHFGASNSQTGGGSSEGGRKTIDITQYHNYATQWDGNCVTGYVDGERWFQDCNQSHLPPRAMKMALQTDFFPGNGPTGEARVQADWHRFYALQ